MTDAVPSGALRSERITSLDLLRGLVMVLMALDHSRDFIGDPRVSPEAVGADQPFLFFTRWITHFCAPSFVFLAGVSAFLHGSRANLSRTAQTKFLVTRGLWLLFLEVTVISFGWFGSFATNFMVFQVIGTIGVAMIALGVLLWLPRGILLAIAVLILAGHNLLDAVTVDEFGAYGGLWTFLHEGSTRAPSSLFGHAIWVQYAVLPWIGILLLGYGFGPMFQATRELRRKQLLWSGLGCCALFVLLRGSGFYGDANGWESGGGAVATLVDFFNTTKYPPSLLFVAMTLGPALVFLSWFDREPKNTPGWFSSALLVFGRVPLFYYALHLFLLQFGSGIFSWVREGTYYVTFESLFRSFAPGSPPLPAGFGNGNDLVTVYIAWILLVLLLFPICKWYGNRKRAGRSWIWSYL